MRVYLTGFMASGKTTVGPRVADRLGRPFLDLDHQIAVQAGRTIPAIFAEEGEDAFRELETDALHRTVDTEELVVALGGGALVDDGNRSFAKEHGVVVYLRVDAQTILDRVGDEADRRPLLQDENGTPLPPEQMRARVETMLAERESTYSDAHMIVDATVPVDRVVDAVVDAVRGYEEKESTSEKA